MEKEQILLQENHEILQERTPIFFYTSTKKGLGHVSRCIAIANALNPASFAVTIGAYEHATPFIHESSVRSTRVQPVNYEFSPTTMPDNLNDPRHYVEFVEKNNTWLSEIKNNSIIVTDFVAPAVYLRKYLLEHDLPGVLIVGVYHSFDGIKPVSPEEEQWQKSVKLVVQALDICFLTELTQKHKIPYITSSGTLIIPVDPIIRPRTLSDAEVKQKIGLNSSDEYILVQAGMRGNAALWDFVQQIPTTGDENYVLLGWDLDTATKEVIQSNPRVRILEAVGFGQDLVAAAKGVIAKPGMQTLSEAAVHNIPIFLLPDTHPERTLKRQMLSALTGNSISHDKNQSSQSVDRDISAWLANLDATRAHMKPIGAEGATQIAQYLQAFSLERSQLDASEYSPPMPILSTPPGKTEAYLPTAESAQRASEIKEEIIQSLLEPLKEASITHTAILFGGVAKERLRPTSDADVLLIVGPEDVHKVMNLIEHSSYSLPRAEQLVDDLLDSLRVKLALASGVELNVSLMTPVSYSRIFQPYVAYFREELGDKISPNPYFVSNFVGEQSSVPKVVVTEKDGVIQKERRSPGIIRDNEKQTVFGVKHRMLLTSEVLSDEFALGDPTVKLMRGMVRAILYWNNLYIYQDEKIVDIKPEAFDPNYFFRLLRDPLHMISPRMQRKVRTLYFNELRRIKALHLSKSRL